MPSISHLAWLIPLLPLLVFLVILLFTRRNRMLSQQLAILSVAISAVLALFTFLSGMVEGDVIPQFPSIRWFSLGTHEFPLGVYVDPVGTVMLCALSLVCLLIFIYALDTVRGDEARGSRFSAILCLFAASLLGLLVFDNLLVFFTLLEIMDVCAYLLIGLRHERRAAREAGLRAFLVSKVGDLFLLSGLALLYARAGSLTYDGVLSGLDALRVSFLGSSTLVTVVVALLLFGGVMVKSGQFPLHVWLLGATEAPSPASALIHAATTAAGAFLLVRVLPLLDVAAGGLLIPGLGVSVVTFAGTLTAVFAAFVAVAQRDVRRALSFSAVGQLGYVVSALGAGAYVAGVFHLIVGVLFNALLFLAAGSVVRGMAQGRRKEDGGEPFAPADMLRMGGLGERQPVTFLVFFVGGIALSGLPLLTGGFWSQDAIMGHVWASSRGVFWALAVAAFLTAFGVMRQLCLIFAGPPRSRAAARAVESAPAVTVSLVVLAVLSLVLGWVGIPGQIPLVGGHWLAAFLGAGDVAPQFVLEPTMIWSGLGVFGLALGFLFYGWRPMRAGEVGALELTMQDLRLGGFYRGVRDGFYIDRLYGWAFGRVPIGLALVCDGFDRFLNGVGEGIAWMGQGLSQLCRRLEVRGLGAAVDLAGRLGRLLALGCDWVDGRVGVLSDLVGRAARYVAGAGALLDLRWDRLLDLSRVGVLAVSRAGGVLDRSLAAATRGVGSAVETAALWFRPATGRVQTYLLTASVALLALVAVFLFLFA